MKWLVLVLFLLLEPQQLFAQIAPTGGHYAGRPSDTGHGGTLADATGSYSASIPLDLPEARSGLPVPLQIMYGARGVGAAGLGWDIPLSYIQQNRTFAHRRPAFGYNVLPQPRERIFLSLLGQSVELVQNGQIWVARSGTLALIARKTGSSWLAYDGAGRTYSFIQPRQLGDSGLWLLKSVSVAGGSNVRITYQVTPWAINDGNGIEINLTGLAYNTLPAAYNIHPTEGCAKHEIALTYGHRSTTPLSLSTFGGTSLVRFGTVTLVDVKSRAKCGTSFQRLRRYELQYVPDSDTQLPRLSTVRMFGRQGTPEETTALPVASYAYGTATRGGTLHYKSSQQVELPPDDDGKRISGTAMDPSVATPGSGNRYAMWQSLIDITGDGRTDLLFKRNGKLWMAVNRPTAGGKTTIGHPFSVGLGIVQLHDSTFTSGAFSTHTTTEQRFLYDTVNNDAATVSSTAIVAANHNTVNVWRQSIDANGDGRLDIIDAAEEPARWIVYLNTPSGAGAGVKWERRSLSVENLGMELAGLGHALDGGYVPLSRRATSGDVKLAVCWRWDGKKKWEWWKDGWAHHQCFGDNTKVLERWPENTFTEWELTDLNGDGYPDFVFNSTPVEFQLREPDWDGPAGIREVVYGEHRIPFAPQSSNVVRAAFNVVGVHFSTDVDPFSRSVSLWAQSSDYGVGKWAGVDNKREIQRQVAGLSDVNGDGLVDRVVIDRAYLGAYLDSEHMFSGFYVTLPGELAVQHSGREQQCAAGPNFTSTSIKGLRDLTGDGVPDYYDQGRVSVGTGTGFAPSIAIVSDVDFVFSHETESCDGKISNTDGGLFDIDGDGQPEVVGLVGLLNGKRAYQVSQLAGSSVPRTPEAGRLTFVDNGYGAGTRVAYKSAKEDLFTAHQVPFPEIVVSSAETVGALNLGGSLAGSRYAHGNAEMVFDSALDAFTFSGYRRSVELRLYLAEPDRSEGAAIVTDTWPLTTFTPMLTKKERWLRSERVGRVRDVYTLRGGVDTNPWSLLSVDAQDPRVIGVIHYEWDAKFYEEPVKPDINWRDCLDMVKPFDFEGSVVAAFSVNSINACGAHGFAFGLSRESWYGTSPPPSGNNVQTESRAIEVDDFGRVTFAKYEGDRFRSDDDLCIENIYAVPNGTFPRLLTALSSRRITDCEKRITYASDSWTYDGLPSGVVSAGLMTSHTVDRWATDNGTLLRTARAFDATYDGAGNLATVSTQRDGSTRTITFGYDFFGLVPTRSTLGATGVPSTKAFMAYDPVSLQPLNSTDANGTQSGADFDGYGRLLRSTVTPPGSSLGVMSTFSYHGFSGTDPGGRRIVVKEFTDPVAPANLATAVGRIRTIFLDELGRARRTEVELGSEYANEELVVGARTYDGFGRVLFEADPYPKSQDPATAYGTSYFFKNTGDVECIIRGQSQQALNQATDVVTERFPTCFNRSFADHVETLEVRDAASLLAGSPQAGVVKRVVSSAIGRVIERSTESAGTRLEHEVFSHDRLGHQTALTRFLNPAGGSDPVRWSWRLDSLGQALELAEPETAIRYYTYSDWGEPIETHWTDGAIDRRLVSKYDALGRLTASEERNDGVVDPETVNKYAYDIGVSVTPLVTPTFVLGRLSSASSPSGQVAFSYDVFGRVDARAFTDNDNDLYIEKTEHHADGSPATLEFNLPDRNYDEEQVKYAYDSAGRLRTMTYTDTSGARELYNAEVIDPFGRVRNALYGGNTSYRADYANEGRRMMKEATVESSLGSWRVIFLGYDPQGRELSRREIKDGGASGPQTNVGYDALGRLRTVTQTDGTTTVSNWIFDYDALGNVIRLDDTLGSADAALSYDAIDRDRICHIGYGNVGPGGGACTVVHDVLGSITSQPTRTGSRQLSYFSSGAVRAIAEQGTQARFAYDAFGRVQELDVQGGATQDKRRDRRYGERIERRDAVSGGSTASLIIRHIPGPAGIVASRRGPSNEWAFEFGELRGNRFFTDQDGTFVQNVDYQPFGEATSTGTPAGSAKYTSYQWNGGDALAAFGLSQLGARVYDPVIGRFLSRDPMLIPRTAATTNPYAFAMNDPLNGVDPSGLDCIGPECQPWVPVLPFGSSGGGSSGSSGSATPATAKAKEQAPSVSSGPQTRKGKDLKFWAEFLYGATFSDAFDFDSAARGSTNLVAVLDNLAHTQNVAAAIDEYNASVDTVSSGLTGIADAMNWTCFWPLCSMAEARKELGITSGDADPTAHTITNIGTSLLMMMIPTPKRVPSLPSMTCARGMCRVAGALCFVGGTLVATPKGDVPIEELKLGDRVEAGNSRCTGEHLPEGTVTIGLEMSDPRQPSNLIKIELARPQTWLHEHGFRDGAVWIELPEIGASGWARVTKVDAPPLEESGDGCLVLMTSEHVASELVKLRLETGTEIEVTPAHPFFVEGRGWVSAGELTPGQLLRSDRRETRLKAIEPGRSNQPVFNIEVGLEHAYRVSRDQIWAHNQSCGQINLTRLPEGHLLAWELATQSERLGPRFMHDLQRLAKAPLRVGRDVRWDQGQRLLQHKEWGRILYDVEEGVAVIRSFVPFK